jgi:hypothetical protein
LAISRYQQINDLITFRQKLKSTLIGSNANTLVKVCGREMTVAETIEEKNSIKHKKILLAKMKQQYASSLAEKEKHNAQMRSNLEHESRRSQVDEKKSESTAKSYCFHNGLVGIYNNVHELSHYYIDSFLSFKYINIYQIYLNTLHGLF